MSFYVEFYGSLGCFTRPEMKTERVSYDVPTPSALRNMMQAIYWHPGMNWKIDRFQICNPIAFDMVYVNEVKKKIDMKQFVSNSNKGLFLPIDTGKHRTQRHTIYLTNLRYIVECHFELNQQATHSADEFAALIGKRLQTGGCFAQPVFGLRECAAYFRQVDGFDHQINVYPGEKDFGWMLYDMEYHEKYDKNPTPHFFRCVAVDGIVDVGHAQVF